MKDSGNYFEVLDVAVELKTSVEKVMEERRNEIARRDLMPSPANKLDEDRDAHAAALAAIEAEEAEMRQAAGQWELMISQRDRLLVRLGNITGLRDQLAATARELSDQITASIGTENSAYNYVTHLARAASTIGGTERAAKILDEAEERLRGDLVGLEASIRAFAQERGIHSGIDEIVSAN